MRRLRTKYPSNRWLVAIVVSFVLGAGAVNAKMYKWVDADGNTHYTQTPPPESAQQTQQMNVKTGPVVKVRKKGKRLYCGKSALPRLDRKPAVTIANLESSILGWEEQILEVKERRSKYIQANPRQVTSKSYKNRMRGFETKLAEIDCKLEWGRSELAALEGDRTSIVQHHEDLKKLEAQLQARKVTECGADTRQGIVVVDDAYRAYQRCVRPYDRELRKLRRQVRRAERDASLVTDN